MTPVGNIFHDGSIATGQPDSGQDSWDQGTDYN